MSIIKDEYLALAPKGENLCDIVVLAQAWKKSHQYIRRHNWYADVLELDVSVINLESQLAHWAQEICQEDFQPNPLRLVPAPKNDKWVFRTVTDKSEHFYPPRFDDWGPAQIQATESQATGQDTHVTDGVITGGISSRGLRPLAHVTIRDQTLATGVLMCLAEAVETAQGNTTGDLSTIRYKRVCSYGNRLHCTWEETPNRPDRAHFAWGKQQDLQTVFPKLSSVLGQAKKCLRRTGCWLDVTTKPFRGVAPHQPC